MRDAHGSETQYEMVVERAWQKVHSRLFQRHCERHHGPPGDDASSDEDDEDGENDDCPLNPPDIIAQSPVNGEPMRYDGDEYSDYNRQARERVGAVTMMDLCASVKSYELPHKFAALMFENPHNLNVSHTQKSGFFKYFDGETWSSKNISEFDVIADGWKAKVKQFHVLMGEKYGPEWSTSFMGMFADKTIKMFEFVNPECVVKHRALQANAKKDSLRVIQNAITRMNDIKRRRGKRVRRVLCDSDFETRGKKVLRNTTWGELQLGDLQSDP